MFTTLPAQSSSVPVSVSLNVSQFVPSTHVSSFGPAPPVTGPCQTTFGPVGPIAPVAGFEASTALSGLRIVQTAHTNIHAVRNNVPFLFITGLQVRRKNSKGFVARREWEHSSLSRG